MNEIVVSRAALFSLPEYSCSFPTRTTIGKRWRRNIHAYNRPAVPEDQHEWQIGEYVEHHDPEMVGVNWTRAVDENHEPHRGRESNIPNKQGLQAEAACPIMPI